MTKPKSIFFDWDGTLVDSFEFLERAHNHVRAIYGMGPFAPGEFRGYFGMPRQMLYTKIYGDDWESARAHFEEYVDKNHMKLIKPLPGAEELVDALRTLKIKSGIVSNKKNRFVTREVEKLGWTDVFPILVGSGDAAQDKPEPAPLLLALSKAGLEKSAGEVFYVGDSETDAKCAQAVGCPLIIIDYEGRARSWVAPYEPVAVFNDCPEFAKYLFEIMGGLPE
jgi:phosphoglycolate phosphatase